MMNQLKKALAFAALTLTFCGLAPNSFAMVSPLGISLVPPLQFPPVTFTIAGARINFIFGDHYRVYGFDLGGVGNITEQDLTGLQIAGGFNYNKGESHAILAQVSGLGNWNINKSHTIGIQAAALLNLNKAESFNLGVVVALANLTEHTEVAGIEVGAYNVAREVYGLQIGVINKVDDLHGLQIGLLNFNTKGIFAVSPFLNFGF